MNPSTKSQFLPSSSPVLFRKKLAQRRYDATGGLNRVNSLRSSAPHATSQQTHEPSQPLLAAPLRRRASFSSLLSLPSASSASSAREPTPKDRYEPHRR